MLTAAGVLFGLGEPLNPMQLLWINLVSDIFPELALGVEPPETDVMQRTPREAETPMFSRSDIHNIIFEGALLTASALAAYGWGLARYGIGPRASGMAFTSLTVAQLLHALSCRSECSGLFCGQPLSPNPYLGMAIAGGITLQSLAVFMPGLRSLVGAGPLGLTDWGISLISGVVPLFINELRKITRASASTNALVHSNAQEGCS
ncbi:MAG: cation-translocating P-type ATPase C-terminal domain-containing protein [Anaerolineae bacterium]|nr:cation-translocating P-type ATPase C-terminal domain-containing protein [Anaerolineae bacterium]